MSKKSILEQALLQVQDLEEAVKANAKGILASTMKEELNELLKESMEEEESNESLSLDKEDEQGIPEVAAEQFDSEDEENDDETSINNEPTDDEDPDLEDEVEDDALDTEDDSEVDDMFDAIDSEDEEEDVLDMTDASDEEVLKVFKSMKPEDGIVVKRDGDNVELEDGDDEYIIKLEDEVSDEVADEDLAEEEDCTEGCDDSEIKEDDSEEDDVVYEIDLDESDDEVAEEEVSEEEVSDEDLSEEEEFELEVPEEDTHEGEVDEAARTKSNVHGDKGGANRAGIKSKTKYKAGSDINEEVKTLRKQNGEYKKALVLFKDKLNEVAVFNANLAYSTRLFTEHSTTRNEKLNILKRFDTVGTLTESKSTYKTIKGELESSKNVTESVVNKITSNNPTTSSSQDVLSESKAYESPQFSRMKELMSKIK
jgi:hypothetical protein